MTIDNSDYGGFVVSKNVLAGKQIHYTFREKSSIAALNGWTVYSVADDDKYVNEADNFQVVSASTLFKLAPVMLELFNAPYGTDLCWLYEQRGPYRFL
ncbi:immunity protein Imm33 domain-containing protein [Carnobacterium gallinarum]|uniref:immunity protein Imm33 domain-containing protein n=1 Tax=Carnobacterium gallinarum TaxID=2749 RepID=UPI000A424FEF